MKVLCIARKEWKIETTGKPVEGPKYMETVTVTGRRESNNFYYLAEYSEANGKPIAWDPQHFVPLSDKDETEYADQVLQHIFEPVNK